MKSRPAVALAVIGAAILTLVMTAPDLAFWRTLDRGAPPIRALVLGDQDYYLLRLHAAVLEGGPAGSPFFEEHRADPPRFVLFESAVGFLSRALGPWLGTGAVAWANLVRAFAVSALFLELLYVLRRYAKLPILAAASVALSACLWQEPFAMRVQYALGAWFLPVAFGAFLLAVTGFGTERRLGRLARLLAASVLFAVHPIAFVSGSLAVGFVWLMRLYERRTVATLLEAAAWGLPTFALGFFLFGGFAFASDAAIAAETLARNAAVATHLPVAPLSLVRGAALLALVALCRRAAEDGSRGWWDLLLAWCAATFIGQNLNLLTGRYFLGDHFLFMERLIAVAAGASVLALPDRAVSRRERTIAALAALGLAAYGLGWLAGHPVRSWLLAGSLAPFFAGSALLVSHALGRRPALPRLAPAAFAGLAALSLAYAGMFLWRLERGFAPAHAASQSARPLLEALDLAPAGVVLANPELSGLVAMHTRQRPYWSPIAFIDEAPNAELERRWQDALAFFPEDPLMTGEAARASVYGNESLFCDSLAERKLYGPLRALGLLGETPCRTALSADAWKEKEEAALAGPDARWVPGYRLDYLVLDLEKGERVPSPLASRFERVTEAGGYAIYRYLP